MVGLVLAPRLPKLRSWLDVDGEKRNAGLLFVGQAGDEVVDDGHNEYFIYTGSYMPKMSSTF